MGFRIIGAIIIILTAFVIMPIGVAAQNKQTPIGVWRTIDDVSGKPKAIVKIWQAANDKLYGKVLKLFPQPGVNLSSVCKACKGERHNQRVVGMTFLQNMRKSKRNKIKWSGGKILDPKTGKEYHCSMQVAENGQKLNVRGYLGLPMFGRTQTWVREPTSPIRT